MRVYLSLFFALSLLAPAWSQTVWEKPIAPGLTYRMEVDARTPLVIHALRWSLKAPGVVGLPELAGGSVYEEPAAKDQTGGRRTVSHMSSTRQALAAINVDFFPLSGDPLGLMVRSGELLSHAGVARSAFAWGPQAWNIGVAQFRGSVKPDGKDAFPLNGLNQECGLNEVVLNTPIAGHVRVKTPSVLVVLRSSRTAIAPSGTWSGTVDAILSNVEETAVQPGTVVLTAQGESIPKLSRLTVGSTVTVTTESPGFNWEHVEHAVAGGPGLVVGGQKLIDWEAQNFRPAFANNRHPRTAIGITPEGDVWLVVVDGRQSHSAGVTLNELADIMLRLGCRDAINVDGGGSSAMHILGVTVNRPSDGREREVANGLLLFGPKPVDPGARLRLLVPARVSPGQRLSASVVDASGNAIPGSEVLFAATGDAWIDQSGTLRPLRNGKVTVFAAARGAVLQAETVVAGMQDTPATQKPR